MVDVLLANGSKYNLLNSALLELFEFIRTENMKSLVNHLAETFRSEFEGITYIDTFSGLLLKYEQAQDVYDQGDPSQSNGTARGPPTHAIGGMVGAHGRGLDRSEEDYFNEDSDDEDEANTTSVLSSLAESYGSDGEDDQTPSNSAEPRIGAQASSTHDVSNGGSAGPVDTINTGRMTESVDIGPHHRPHHLNGVGKRSRPHESNDKGDPGSTAATEAKRNCV